jgi:hypothetical protein
MAGNFSLAHSLRSLNTLVFSFIGFSSARNFRFSNSQMTVIMHEDLTALDEVVVTGYAADYESGEPRWLSRSMPSAPKASEPMRKTPAWPCPRYNRKTRPVWNFKIDMPYTISIRQQE